MPRNPAKYGIKIFILAEAKTFCVKYLGLLGKQTQCPSEIDNPGTV